MATAEELRALARACPDTLLVADLAYVEFAAAAADGRVEVSEES